MTKKERIEKRNELIVRKFYELYDVKRMRIDDVLKELEEKYFFLDKNYMYSIVFYNKKWFEFYNCLIDSQKKMIKI